MACEGHSSVQAMPLELAVERAPAQAEQTRGSRFVTVNECQCPQDMFALDIDEWRRKRGLIRRRSRPFRVVGRRQTVLQGVNCGLKIGIAGHQDRLALGTDAAKRTEYVQAGQGRAGQ
jgi:hypothetical protein